VPNRIIRESCRTSPTLDALSDGAERLFWRLTTVADDFGRFPADVRVVLASCFPLRVDRPRTVRVGPWLLELQEAGLVRFYSSAGRVYGLFSTWDCHQTRRAKAAKYPSDDTGEPLILGADVCYHLRADDGGRTTYASEESRNRGIEESRNEETSGASGAATSPSPETSRNGDRRKQALEILAFLNDRAGRSFRPSPRNLAFVEARLRSGISPALLRRVVVEKVREWASDDRMREYLRPETLFNETKCESYVGRLSRDVYDRLAADPPSGRPCSACGLVAAVRRARYRGELVTVCLSSGGGCGFVDADDPEAPPLLERTAGREG
jgi:uncharacterized phage protein (TIGR02220 family)